MRGEYKPLSLDSYLSQVVLKNLLNSGSVISLPVLLGFALGQKYHKKVLFPHWARSSASGSWEEEKSHREMLFQKIKWSYFEPPKKINFRLLVKCFLLRGLSSLSNDGVSGRSTEGRVATQVSSKNLKKKIEMFYVWHRGSWSMEANWKRFDIGAVQTLAKSN